VLGSGGAAVRLALALRDRVWELAEAWSRLGFDLQLAAGIALGHATVGRIGSEHRWEYAPVGTVPTLAERLCESAAPGQILISRRVFARPSPSPSPNRQAISPSAASTSPPRPGTSSAWKHKRAGTLN
jgi:class 3 adenylate cyclase